MKIAFFVSKLSKGGAERKMSYLANVCAQDEKNTAFLLVLDKSVKQLDIDSRIQTIQIGNGISKKSSILDINKRIKDLRQFMIEEMPDVILCFAPSYAVYTVIARGKRLSTKIVCSVNYNPFFRKLKKGGLYELAEKFFLSKIDGFTFETIGAQSYYPQSIQDKSVVIPNGLIASDLPETVVPFNARNQKKICAVGRLSSVKDYPTMLSAFTAFHETHSDYSLDIYGEGEEREALQKLIDELGLKSHIKLQGNRNNVVSIISTYGIYIGTSISEGWSLSLLEAMACGLPCIFSDCDFGPRNMIVNGESGILVQVGDINGFANALKSIADNQILAEKFANNALYVREKFSGQRMYDSTMEFINKVVSSN